MNDGVFVVGAFPPPLHGMAKNTEAIAQELGEITRVIRVDVSADTLRRSVAYHLRRFRRVFVGIIRLLSTRHVRSLYIASDGGIGMVYTVAFVFVARLLRLNIYIHHRSFAYIDEKTRIASLLVRISGAASRHIFLCECMRVGFSRRYGSGYKVRIVSNAQHVMPVLIDEVSNRNDIITLGHLSNLSEDKGLSEVLEVARRLINGGRVIKLLLAGPAATEAAEDQVRSAINELGSSIAYMGPVYGDRKAKFFRSIDIFLFPTKYVNEAQPNVVFEALSHGVPVVAMARGCIAEDLSSGGIATQQSEYVSKALEYILETLRDRDLLLERKRAAHKVAELARQNAVIGYENLISEIADMSDTLN